LHGLKSIGEILAIEQSVFICSTFAKYTSWKRCGRKFVQKYFRRQGRVREQYTRVETIRITIQRWMGGGCKQNKFFFGGGVVCVKCERKRPMQDADVPEIPMEVVEFQLHHPKP
jgi:hypothetical protein